MIADCWHPVFFSNMKTVSTAVEELRDTVNEKIGEEKTAREEVDVDDGVEVDG